MTSPGIVYTYMGMTPNGDNKKPVPPQLPTVVLLLGTIADTTWRMFVPTIGGMLLGMEADKSLRTAPWLMTIGLALGVYITYLLIRNQMKKVKTTDDK